MRETEFFRLCVDEKSAVLVQRSLLQFWVARNGLYFIFMHVIRELVAMVVVVFNDNDVDVDVLLIKGCDCFEYRM